MPDNRQFSSLGPVAQVTKMANAHKAFGQDVHQEPLHELLSLQALGLNSGTIAVILMSEQDPVTVHRQQAPVTDGDSMSVASQITDHVIALAQAGPVFGHLFALGPGCLQSGYRPFPNQVVFKLSQGTKDMKYQAATRTGGVDGFRQ